MPLCAASSQVVPGVAWLKPTLPALVLRMPAFCDLLSVLSLAIPVFC